MNTSLTWDHSKKDWEDIVKGTPEDLELAKTVNMFFVSIVKLLNVTNDGDIVAKTFFSMLRLLGIIGTIESIGGIKSSQIVEKLINHTPNSVILLENLEIILSLSDEKFESDKKLTIKMGENHEG